MGALDKWLENTRSRMGSLDEAAGDKGMGAIGMVSPLGKAAQIAKSAGPALRSGLSRIGTKQPAYSLPKSLDRINNQRFMTPELQQQMVFGAGRVPGAFSQAAGAAKTALKASPVAALGVGIGYNAGDMMADRRQALPPMSPSQEAAYRATGERPEEIPVSSTVQEERLMQPSHVPNAPIDYRAAGMPYKGGDTAVGADDWRGYKDGRYVDTGPRIIRKDGKLILTNVDTPGASNNSRVSAMESGLGQRQTGTLGDGSTYTYFGEKPSAGQSTGQPSQQRQAMAPSPFEKSNAIAETIDSLYKKAGKVGGGPETQLYLDQAEALKTLYAATSEAEAKIASTQMGEQGADRRNAANNELLRDKNLRDFSIEEQKLIQSGQALPADIASKNAYAKYQEALAGSVLPARQKAQLENRQSIYDNIQKIYTEASKSQMDPLDIQALVRAYLQNVQGKGEYVSEKEKESNFLGLGGKDRVVSPFEFPALNNSF